MNMLRLDRESGKGTMKTQRMIVFAAMAVLLLLNASTAIAEEIGNQARASHTQITKPAGIDLDVTYISRSPLYNR